MKSTEKATQRAILDYLELSSVFHWRNNTGGFKDKSGHFYRFGALGSPDIFAILPPTGQIVGIEVKDTKGKVTNSQREFREKLVFLGGQYIVARSLDDVIPVFGRPKWKPKRPLDAA